MDLSYHGVMVGMRTKIEILKDENELVYTALRKFPVAHLNLESKIGGIRLFYPGRGVLSFRLEIGNREIPPGSQLRNCRTIHQIALLCDGVLNGVRGCGFQASD